MALVLEGKTSKEIGRTLGLSDKTVDTYVKRVMRHYDVGDRRTAAKLAMAEKADEPVGELVDRSSQDDEHPSDPLGSPSGSQPYDLPTQAARDPSSASGVRETAAAYHFEPQGWSRRLPRSLRPLVRGGRRSNELSVVERLLLIFRGAMVFAAVFILLTFTLLAFGAVDRWLIRP